MIISLRGTNGSGKTTVVRSLMQADAGDGARSLYGMLGIKYPEAYRLNIGGSTLFVLGPYTTPSACGLDGVTDYDVQLALVRKYAERGNVLFEGLISGKLWGRMGALLEELASAHGVVLLYLDTPLEECIRRVVERRRLAGDDRPFNEKNLLAVYDQVRSNLAAVRQKKIEGLRVEEISSEDAPARVLQLLRAA